MTALLRKLHFGHGSHAAPRVALRPISVAERLASPQVALSWLVRLRWHALVALAVAMTLAPFSMGVSVAWLPAVALVGGVGLSNGVCLLWARSNRPVHPMALGAVLLCDTLLLTAALGLSGGAQNPFISLYVIQVTLAALLLDAAWVSLVGLASVAGYALLLARPLVAVSMGVESRLMALAAGAAHELAPPLGSIAVASTELEALIGAAPELTAGSAGPRSTRARAHCSAGSSHNPSSRQAPRTSRAAAPAPSDVDDSPPRRNAALATRGCVRLTQGFARGASG